KKRLCNRKGKAKTGVRPVELKTGVRLDAILRSQPMAWRVFFQNNSRQYCKTFSPYATISTSLLKVYLFKCRLAMQDSCARTQLTRGDLAARMRGPWPVKHAQKSRVVCIT